MKKMLALGFIVSLSPLIAGIYGIMHDQLTYTLSPEYYTKFKFIQFGMYAFGEKEVLNNPRIYVACVGFLATWWMGPPIAIILGSVGMLHADHRRMFKITLLSFLIVMGVAFISGLAGLALGKFYLAKTGVSWWLPDTLVDKTNFIAVGSMHNFSYFGGLTGLITGVVYSLTQRNMFRENKA